MSNMKKIAIGALLCLLSIPLKAQVSHIQVWLSSGKQVQYKLSERPRVVREAKTLRLTTSSVDVVYQAGEVYKITYLIPSGLDAATTTPQQNGTITIADEQMQIIGFVPNESIQIFDASGRLLKQVKADEKGSQTISLSAFPAGTYIVKSQQQSSKFIRK